MQITDNTNGAVTYELAQPIQVYPSSQVNDAIMQDLLNNYVNGQVTMSSLSQSQYSFDFMQSLISSNLQDCSKKIISYATLLNMVANEGSSVNTSTTASVSFK